ncbi:ATP-binding cassette domain-containing protein [Candidatus Fermentibacteria bacterium]|nr:ATP-binding cassette domain-containing protein [Candidatus Fermentibacteria bacterium]
MVLGLPDRMERGSVLPGHSGVQKGRASRGQGVMNVPARGTVSFEGVSLDYRLYHDRTVSLMETFLNLFNRRTRVELFRALDDVTFRVQPGQSVGIVGPNGAGKSTTLKLLAGIYRPTSGVVESVGRKASLLDLGVGFHPELTGAENVFLNGALLGLDRQRMRELLPSIAEFSELERFMDIPVKYFSSGMFMRLGFSLATSVDPDVLLIDEVLAVGDASFQQKCYDRIMGFQGTGRTIIFVSHDMEAVSRLCERVIWLNDGRVVMDGGPDEVIGSYVSQTSRPASTGTVDRSEWGTREVRFESVEVRNESGVPSRRFRPGQPIVVDADIVSSLRGTTDGIVFGFSLHRPDGQTVLGTNNLELNRPLLKVDDRLKATLSIDLQIAEPGEYLMGLALTDPARNRDYHWLDYRFRITLLGERKERPVVLRQAKWECRE